MVQTEPGISVAQPVGLLAVRYLKIEVNVCKHEVLGSRWGSCRLLTLSYARGDKSEYRKNAVFLLISKEEKK